MLRQLPNQQAPVAGSTSLEVTLTDCYGFKMTPPLAGQAAGSQYGALLVTVLGKGVGSDPIVYHPAVDGWISFAKPIRGLRVVALSGTLPISFDLWWGTSPEEHATPQEPIPRGVTYYGPTSVPGGAANNSPILDTTGANTATVYVDNAAGAVGRAVGVLGYNEAGTLIWTVAAATTVAAGAVAWVTVGQASASLGSATGLPIPLPPRISFQVAAVGVAASSIYVWMR